MFGTFSGDFCQLKHLLNASNGAGKGSGSQIWNVTDKISLDKHIKRIDQVAILSITISVDDLFGKKIESFRDLVGLSDPWDVLS